jgi:opacity protein-like surface antigen
MKRVCLSLLFLLALVSVSSAQELPPIHHPLPGYRLELRVNANQNVWGFTKGKTEYAFEQSFNNWVRNEKIGFLPQLGHIYGGQMITNYTIHYNEESMVWEASGDWNCWWFVPIR